MRTTISILLLACGPLVVAPQVRLAASDAVKETTIAGPDGLALKVRMEGPYTADAPLQVVCYFKYTALGAKRMTGAPVELDKHLGGVITALRERGEFIGEELETLLLVPPEGRIKAKALLLVGLGDESSLSLEKMERVGKAALREATRLGVRKTAFAPLIRDQGNTALAAGEIARSVVRGVILARDTEGRLAKEALGKGQTLNDWVMEAGPKYYEETVEGVRKAVSESAAAIAARPKTLYTAAKQ